MGYYWTSSFSKLDISILSAEKMKLSLSVVTERFSASSSLISYRSEKYQVCYKQTEGIPILSLLLRLFENHFYRRYGTYLKNFIICQRTSLGNGRILKNTKDSIWCYVKRTDRVTTLQK